VSPRAVVLGAALGAIACGPRAPAAGNLSAYSAELETCLEKGKAASSFAVYKACAEEVDRRYRR
jgi:hypothetical protein